MRPALRLLAVLTGLAVVASPGPALAAKKASRPSVSVIRKLLKEHYIGDSAKNYPTTRYDWRLVGSPLHGASRLGRYRADGTPPNTKTTVFPVKARSRYTVCFPDGTFRQEAITAEYVFFRDEFRAWTFRVKKENRPFTPAAPGACPIP